MSGADAIIDRFALQIMQNHSGRIVVLLDFDLILSATEKKTNFSHGLHLVSYRGKVLNYLSQTKVYELARRIHWRHSALSLLKSLNVEKRFVPIIASTYWEAVVQRKVRLSHLNLEVFASIIEPRSKDRASSLIFIADVFARVRLLKRLINSGRFPRIITVISHRQELPLLKVSTGVVLKGDPALEAAAHHLACNLEEVRTNLWNQAGISLNLASNN